MSFCSEQKSELMKTPMKNSCCRRAMLEGILSAKGTVSQGETVISFSDVEIATFSRDLIFEVYGKEISFVQNPAGGRGILGTFHSPAAEKYLTEQEETLSVHHFTKCPFCKNAFVKGLFLSSGRLSNPEKQYSLEFSVGERAFLLQNFFEREGIDLSVSKKENETTLYTRNSSGIEDVFALAGMNQTTFQLMNSKIQNEIRNNANRIANCETNNIEKAVNASRKQVSEIERLEKQNLLSMLPEELEKTARLRLQNPHLSLSQLAAIMSPPISKPGLSHRMERISALAKELLGKE